MISSVQHPRRWISDSGDNRFRISREDADVPEEVLKVVLLQMLLREVLSDVSPVRQLKIVWIKLDGETGLTLRYRLEKGMEEVRTSLFAVEVSVGLLIQ